MVFDESKMNNDAKWMKEIRKFVKKQKWTKAESIKYLDLASKTIGSEVKEVIEANDNDFLSEFEDGFEEKILTKDDILSETIILTQDGEGHN